MLTPVETNRILLLRTMADILTDRASDSLMPVCDRKEITTLALSINGLASLIRNHNPSEPDYKVTGQNVVQDMLGLMDIIIGGDLQDDRSSLRPYIESITNQIESLRQI